jgi:hypothetical protein
LQEKKTGKIVMVIFSPLIFWHGICYADLAESLAQDLQ